MNHYNEINECRICNSKKIINILKLGDQFLTGVFPKSINEHVTSGPLTLVRCESCGLVQLKHSYSLEEMYGENYGYRSGLNGSMVRHLQTKIEYLENNYKPLNSDVVIDIGSNDATSLKAYRGEFRKVGIDPTGEKFKKYYTNGIELIPEFFSYESFSKNFPGKKAKIITSISMFYDLENPNTFVNDIKKSLDVNGVWHFEQSYMPAMLRTNSYDTICHEHLEFYSFKVIVDLLGKHGLKVIDVQTNAINGGSFAVTAAHVNSTLKENTPIINWMLKQEERMKLETELPYLEFEKNVLQHKEDLVSLVNNLVADGKRIAGYGASTKGNVLLQYCNFSVNEIFCIADVNEDKHGCFTPGTNIPIVSEKEARDLRPDYFLVLPWHFKHSILEREKDFIQNGGKFIFPLPVIEII
jgi:hypothetical protein